MMKTIEVMALAAAGMVTVAGPLTQAPRQLTQELVSGAVPLRVINHLELVEVQIDERVPAVIAVHRVQHALESLFKLSAVD